MLALDVIHQTTNHSLKMNTVREEQVNSHHGAVKRKYIQGQAILVKDYRNDPRTHYTSFWECYNCVYIQGSTWVRHANQLRQSKLPETKSNSTITLLNTFEMPQQRPQEMLWNKRVTPSKNCTKKITYATK